MRNRTKRLLYICGALFISAAIVSLVLYALRQNLNLYYTPSEVPIELPYHQQIRVGGLVQSGTVKHLDSSQPQVNFMLTDTIAQISVTYTGVLPDLFREGQGVVVTGKLNADGIFNATQVLAKHDERYMPPNLADKVKVDEL